ncbi:hypothetical protein J4G33_02525 [Actinotalea sp. BY-33]|uniref:Uncharacterized protein n=1 Tax=Actinotalea soli TaxID=2819234 RepID=A0A939LMI4_9CELL|nr:hypothetical protein [Actinotalea soli]MBO1750672.1 hypothetical protein [Actinotalea soli]
MAALRRRTRLPAEIRSEIGLPRDEPVLAAAPCSGGWAVATRSRLVVSGGVLEHPWHEVDGARLDPETRTLTITWVDGSPKAEVVLEEEGAQRFVRVLHERVQASVVHREQVSLPRGATVRVALRRGADGGLLTQVIGDGRVDLSDPATAAAVDAAEARVREAAGLH